MTDLLDELMSLTDEEQEEWENALSALLPRRAAAPQEEQARETARPEEGQTEAEAQAQTEPAGRGERPAEQSGKELEKQIGLMQEGLERVRPLSRKEQRTAERPADPAAVETVQLGPMPEPETQHSRGSGALARQVERASRLGSVPSLPAQTAGESRGLSLPKPGERMAAQDQVRQVDRAFERDARRYDCGFTLF